MNAFDIFIFLILNLGYLLALPKENCPGGKKKCLNKQAKKKRPYPSELIDAITGPTSSQTSSPTSSPTSIPSDVPTEACFECGNTRYLYMRENGLYCQSWSEMPSMCEDKNESWKRFKYCRTACKELGFPYDIDINHNCCPDPLTN